MPIPHFLLVLMAVPTKNQLTVQALDTVVKKVASPVEKEGHSHACALGRDALGPFGQGQSLKENAPSINFVHCASCVT